VASSCVSLRLRSIELAEKSRVYRAYAQNLQADSTGLRRHAQRLVAKSAMLRGEAAASASGKTAGANIAFMAAFHLPYRRPPQPASP